MTVQQASEADNFNSFQLRKSFGAHESRPGSLLLNKSTPPEVWQELEGMDYKLRFSKRTSGPIDAIFFDRKHGNLWGGSSDYGEDYGISW